MKIMKKTALIFPALLFISLVMSSALLAASDTTAWDFAIRDFNIRLVEQRFDPEKHKIEMYKENSRLISKIDGSFPYGYGFEMPYSQLASFTIEYGNRTYQLDTSNMYNAWHNNKTISGPHRDLDISCTSHNTCLVRGLFAGEVALYMASWELNIRTGTARRIKLSASEDDTFPLLEEFSK
jgi:hypothetical protein